MMYTVIRFQCLDSGLSIQELGEQLQRCSFISYEGPDKGVANRVSCTVATDDEWHDHLSSVERFLELSAEVVEWARLHRVELSFDVAIEPDDYDGILGSFSIPHKVLTRISTSGIDLTISVYR